MAVGYVHDRVNDFCCLLPREKDEDSHQDHNNLPAFGPGCAMQVVLGSGDMVPRARTDTTGA